MENDKKGCWLCSLDIIGEIADIDNGAISQG